MDKHTPAPWSIYNTGKNFIIRPREASKSDVANIMGKHDADDITGYEAYANAKIIAAAPDMYKAIQSALKAVELNNEHPMTASEAVLRNVIMKAERG